MTQENLYDVGQEQALLGSLLIDPDMLVMVKDKVQPDDFYIHKHRWLYETMLFLNVNHSPIDLLTVSDELNRKEKLKEFGGPAYLSELMDATPTSTHARHYAELVAETAMRRYLRDGAGEIAGIAHNPNIPVIDALQQTEDIVARIRGKNGNGKSQPIKYYAEKHYDRVQEISKNGKPPGLMTDLISLNNMLGGLKNGKLYLVAGRPGMGKSALGLQCGLSIARDNHWVDYYSLEMTGNELTNRIISGLSGIDGERLDNGEIQDNEWSKYFEALEIIETLPFHISDQISTIEGLSNEIILHSAKGLKLAIIDYIQLIDTSKNYQNRDSEIGAVSKTLKNLARSLNIPIIAIASLNRKCEERSNKRPMLGDLRESGSLEYDADVVKFLYRDEIYNEDTEFPNIAEIIIGKNRGGKTGIIKAFFKKHLTQFVDVETRTHRF